MQGRRKGSRSQIPFFLFLAGIILIAGSILSALLLSRDRSPVAGDGQPQSAASEIPRVTPAEAKEALDAGSAVFLDVRDSASFAEAHIPGAISIPLGELESRLDELDPDAWIITYCT